MAVRKAKWLGAALCLSLLCMTAGCGDRTEPHPVSASGDETAETAAEGTQTVTDSLGRRVVIPKEVRRAAITNAYNAELITAIGAAEKICGVDHYIFQDQEGFKHRFTEDMVIGTRQGGLNFEKIAEMAPDVLILCENDGWENAEAKLAPFGIPVVVCNSYYTGEFFENVRLLGEVFQEQSRAEELASYFKEKLDYVDRALSDVPRRRVYFEYRTAGRTTIPGDYFYEMVEKAHGDNIFKDADAVQIQIEEVAKRDPAYIVKVSEANVYSSYIPPTEEDMARIRSDIAARPGWDATDAVRNDRILLLSHYAHGGASKLVGSLYLAKFLYPEYLPELDPEEVFRKWVETYEGLTYHAGHTSPAF